ncbi:methionine ABC transporter substrate-binding protein [Miniimonas arenae]|uniref:Methionine ABC transporter substrate-binding protein n=1 Tax=Miniimonas arenae TaxID=676201 RepID=A0A5C5B7Z3_9MICO|nr:MetQ/NlpA family ABC transporter substrate-binding protein [Miniimonas arenae]TNU73103.1 methionine ABC transporter substrate-binding protein [Miniimonas arenae]
MTRRLPVLVTAAVAALAMAACAAPGSGGSDSDATDGGTIRIGVIGASDTQWDVFTQKAEEEGIDVEIVNFTDYQIPNQALADGELELNQFQHLQFLANFNLKTGNDLQPIGGTAVYPLNLYSTEYDDVADIPDGAQIAVPNDATNLARALLNLQQAGLITLRDGGTSFSAAADVIADESRVTVTPVDAAQTAAALTSGSVAAAIINNDFVGKAGLTDDDIVYADDPSGDAAKPYINVFAARAEDSGNETYLKLVEIWHDPEVEAAATEDSGGLAIFKNNEAGELQDILADIQANAPTS